MPERWACPSSRLDWQLLITLALMGGLLAPIVVVPEVFFPYVVPRNILFRLSVEVAAAALAFYLALGRKRLDLRGEPILFAVGGFLAAVASSAIASAAREHSFNGDFERMGGVWAWLHLGLFMMLVRTLEWRYLVWLLNVAVGVSAYASAHFIFGYFFGGAAGIGLLSLLGNPGLFAGYLLLSTALALYLAGGNTLNRWLYAGAALIDLVALLLTQNRSSVLGLIAGAFVATILLVVHQRGTKRWLPFAWTAGIAALLLAPGIVRRIALTDFGGRDAARAYQWNAAVAGFIDRPLLGFGLENHHLVWSAHFDPRIYQIGTEVFDRTHNTFLEMLATTGMIGTASFLAIWLAIGYALYRAFLDARLNARELAVLAGANVAYAVYLLFWFVDINAAMLWMLVLTVIAGRYRSVPVVRDRADSSRSAWSSVASVVAAGALVAFLAYAHGYIPLRTSAALATIDSYSANPDPAFAAVSIVAASSAPQTSHSGLVLAQFIASLERRGELRMPLGLARRSDIDRTFSAAIGALDAELRRDPLNDRLYTSLAGVLIEASSFYSLPAHLERAISLLKRAIELSPGRREQRLLLETAYARREGTN